MQLSSFGKSVTHRLIDLDKTNDWLIREIKARSESYMDSSFLARLMSGRATSAPKMKLIDKILTEEEERQNGTITMG